MEEQKKEVPKTDAELLRLAGVLSEVIDSKDLSFEQKTKVLMFLVKAHSRFYKIVYTPETLHHGETGCLSEGGLDYVKSAT